VGISDWFKGKRAATETRAAAENSPPAITRPDEFITAYDERGRELKVKRADWVASVLMPAIEKAWNDPKQLSAQIVQALRDDFVAQVAAAAERLVELERESAGSLVLASIVRMNRGDLDGAERALARAVSKHGTSGVVLTNLAKVLERRGQVAKSRATLRQGLELDPNQDNGVGWWAAIAREEKGDAGYVSALAELAAIPGAWRPQFWLARERLKQSDRAGALELYDEVLTRAAQVPEALMAVTGDLGNAGALDDLVRLGAPRYAPEVHGPPTGLNLIQAYKQLGRNEEALTLVRKLQAMRWPPFAASLAALESELVSKSMPIAAPAALEVGALTFESPIWTRGLFEPEWLLPARADTDPLVALFTFANETAAGNADELQKADDRGRLTRALPVYLAEVLRLRFQLRARATLLVAKHHGPAVFGKQLAREVLEGAVSSVAGRRIVIAGSLTESGVKLELWELGGSGEPTLLTVEASIGNVSALTTRVERAIVDALKRRVALVEAQLPAFYDVPPDNILAGYVSALEQLLYQVLAANEVVRPDSLWNERGFFEAYCNLVDTWASAPDSARLIAICGTTAAAQYESALLEPYRKIVLKWLSEAAPESALRKLAPAVFKRLNERERFARWFEHAPPLADAGYSAWLERVKGEAWEGRPAN
jgi:tetratricopeptide (TPR) repeat protein